MSRTRSHRFSGSTESIREPLSQSPPEKFILLPYPTTPMQMEEVVNNLTKDGAHYCDIRREKWQETFITIKDRTLETVIRGEEEGAMVRVLWKNGWGYAGTSDLATLTQTAERALSMARINNKFKERKTGLSKIEIHEEERKIPMKQNISDIRVEEKISFLRELENLLDEPFVESTELGYRDSIIRKEIVTSDGSHISMEIPKVFIYIAVIGKGDSIQRVLETSGSTGGYELTKNMYHKTERALEKLKCLLEAKSPPSGVMPLLIDPHLTGLFIHEAFGHAVEGDIVTSGGSCLEERLRKKIASEKVTIRDDPTLQGYGSFPFDDEGTRARSRTLVKDGVLVDYIVDRENGWKLGLESNGGARAEDFRVKPLVRMSNMIMEPGDMTFEELVEDVDRGVYAQSIKGGQANPAQGTFQFSAQVGYLIERGEITHPLLNVSFSGFMLDSLKNVIGIGKDFDMSASLCRKPQTVTVSGGGPHVLIRRVTVGGRT